MEACVSDASEDSGTGREEKEDGGSGAEEKEEELV